MHFVVIGLDGNDAEALDRRMANRDAHLARAKVLFASGNLITAGALTDHEGRMIGSLIQYDFPARADLDAVLKNEPYVINGVWEDITVQTIKLADFSAG